LLCSPFIEALSENEAFDIVVPRNSDSEIDNVLEFEMDDENVLGRKSKVVRQLTDLDGCKVYAQIMAVAAFVLELKSGKFAIVSECLVCIENGNFFSRRANCVVKRCVLCTERIVSEPKGM